jgi:hypothetical protein
METTYCTGEPKDREVVITLQTELQTENNNAPKPDSDCECECTGVSCENNGTTHFKVGCCRCRQLTFCGDLGCLVYSVYKFFTNYIFFCRSLSDICRCFRPIIVTPLMYIIPKLTSIIIVNFSQKSILGENYENEKSELIAQNIDTKQLTDEYDSEIVFLDLTVMACVFCQVIIFFQGTNYFVRTYDKNLPEYVNKLVYINVFIGFSFCIAMCLLAQYSTLGGYINIIDGFGSMTLTILSWWIIYCKNENRIWFCWCNLCCGGVSKAWWCNMCRECNLSGKNDDPCFDSMCFLCTGCGCCRSDPST